jgi:hypothetical protein
MQIKAWIKAIRPPASSAAAIPHQLLPVNTVTRKPDTAPISIMPSTPRFIIPERSASISPEAANKSGVPA